jgi:hypothetical protein
MRWQLQDIFGRYGNDSIFKLDLLKASIKVDLFITVTANPQWAKITCAILRGQTSYDRPELVARVFELKKTTRHS